MSRTDLDKLAGVWIPLRLGETLINHPVAVIILSVAQLISGNATNINAEHATGDIAIGRGQQFEQPRGGGEVNLRPRQTERIVCVEHVKQVTPVHARHVEGHRTERNRTAGRYHVERRAWRCKRGHRQRRVAGRGRHEHPGHDVRQVDPGARITVVKPDER